MGTATDIGGVVEQTFFTVDTNLLEAELNKKSNGEVVVDDVGAYVKCIPSSPDTPYSLGAGLTTTGKLVFIVGNKSGEPLGGVNLTITGKQGKVIYPLHLTNNVWFERGSLTDIVGPGPYHVVLTPARPTPVAL